MTIQNELHPASFRNVPFLAFIATTAGGRKTITHEFVNSNNRKVEDLGLLNKTFNLTAVITGPNYTAKRNALISALEESGPGPLVHPFFGRVNVVAKPYSVAEDMTALGEARFTLVFERENDESGQPKASTATQANIDKKADLAQAQLSLDVADNFAVDLANPRNFVNAQNQLGDVYDSFSSISQTFSHNISGINNFNSTIEDFNADILSLINDPEALGNSLVNLFDTMRDVAPSSKDLLDGLNKFFSFGADDIVIMETTEERKERARNRQTINNSIAAGALVDSYRTIVEIDFDTVDDIDEEQARLNNQFESVVSNLPADTQIIVGELRNLVRSYLDNARISAKRVISLEINSQPAQILAYSLYGDLDNTEKIIELNGIKDVSFVSGTVQVIT